MNDSTLLQLKVTVERVVRPAQAPLKQKKKMREELLGHLTGVFEDELSRSGNEQDALIQAEMRFGDPAELAKNFEKSFLLKDRVELFVERLIAPRTEESIVQRASRYGLMIFALDAFLNIALCLIIFPLIGKTAQIGISSYILLLVAIAIGWTMFISTLVTLGLGRRLFGTSTRSYLRGVILIIASCLVPVMVPLIIVAGTSPFAAGEWKLATPTLWGIVPMTILYPLLLVALAKAFSNEAKYREEWAQLAID